MPYDRHIRYANDVVYVKLLEEIWMIGSPCSPTGVLLGAGLYKNHISRGTRVLEKMADEGLIRIEKSKRKRGSREVYMTPLGKRYLESHQDAEVV